MVTSLGRGEIGRRELTTFGIDELAEIVVTTFDLGAAQTDTVRSRVKHMQLLGFPKEGVGKGFKASYSIEDAMKVVVAFALLEAGMPSVRAHELVALAWPAVSRTMAMGSAGAVRG